MGSLSFSEIVVIVLVILIVFGPNRLPDLARKAGEFMSKVRNASTSMTDALGVDYEETVEPLLSAKRDFDSIKTDFTKTVTTFGQSAAPSDEDSLSDAEQQETAGGSKSAGPSATAPKSDPAVEPPKAAPPAEVDTPDDSTAAS
jgi:TatA/E family protein of Tat protein translocase